MTTSYKQLKVVGEGTTSRHYGSLVDFILHSQLTRLDEVTTLAVDSPSIPTVTISSFLSMLVAAADFASLANFPLPLKLTRVLSIWSATVSSIFQQKSLSISPDA